MYIDGDAIIFAYDIKQTTNNRHTEMKKCLLVLVLFCTGLSLSAQTMAVKGTVTSSEDGQPLSGVAVILEGTTKGTLTDLDGNWSLDVPESGGGLFYSPASGSLTGMKR